MWGRYWWHRPVRPVLLLNHTDCEVQQLVLVVDWILLPLCNNLSEFIQCFDPFGWGLTLYVEVDTVREQYNGLMQG